MQTIRQLTAADEDWLLDVLRRDPYNNAFLLGDLLSMGMNDPALEYWATYDDSRLTGVLMRFGTNWCAYDAGSADFTAMADLLLHHPAGAKAIIGEYGVTSRLWEHIRGYEAYEDHPSYYMVMDALVGLDGLKRSRKATGADVPRLMSLYNLYTRAPRDEAALRRVLKHGRIFFAEEDGQVVSSALTNVELPDLALVGGVFTMPEKRNCGYATACMSALCRDLMGDSIQPCLFYDNPQAGSIYRRLGFRDIGTWRLVRFRPTEGAAGGASHLRQARQQKE
jgi:GNAT superfamily N-acetyltransferase